MAKRFFTNYFMGGRGDFLNHCLYSGVRDQYINSLLDTYVKLPPLALCVKMHGYIDTDVYTNIPNFPKKFNSWKELFDTVSNYNLVKIKIVASSLVEKFDLAWLAINKVMIHERETIQKLTSEELKLPIPAEKLDDSLAWMFNIVYTSLDQVQKEDHEFIEEYDYIVNFNDLFDSNYIASLFEQVNGKSISSQRYDSIVKNISMQGRLSTSDYYPVILAKYDAFFKM
jgi:hypothetical protein